MPALSKKQQKFMGIVRSIQKGDAPASKFSKKAQAVAKKMKEKDVDKFASTKHKGLPNKVKQEMKLHENPAAVAATQAMTKIKMKNPKTGKEASAVSALKDKDNPNHKKAKSIFQRLKDRFTKKNDDKPKPKKQSKADADFYKRQFAGEEKLREYIRQEIKSLLPMNERMDKKQATELLRQLGGNKFRMMVGAKKMSLGPAGLQMKIGRNSKAISHVIIDLDRGKDLYVMSFIRVRKGIPKLVKKYTDVYADQLNKIFEKETGLYTRL